jgi:hypothetical protein
MVQVAGFGLSIDDLNWIMLFVFVAMTIVQFELNPNIGFIPLIDKKVMGYPVCESIFCFAPSAADMTNAANGFYTLSAPKSLIDFASALVGTFVSSIWVLVKLLIAIMILWKPIRGLMIWYGFWMPHAIN